MAAKPKRKLSRIKRLDRLYRKAVRDRADLRRKLAAQAEQIRHLDNEVHYYWTLVDAYEGWRKAMGHPVTPRLTRARPRQTKAKRR